MQQEPSESLATAIRRVHGGHVYLSESMRSHLLDHFCSPNGGDGSGLEQLTDRELEVFGFGRGPADSPDRHPPPSERQDRRNLLRTDQAPAALREFSRTGAAGPLFGRDVPQDGASAAEHPLRPAAGAAGRAKDRKRAPHAEREKKAAEPRRLGASRFAGRR